MADAPPLTARLTELLDELDRQLKSPQVGAELTERGVNVSLALTLTGGLRAYLAGDKEAAVVDLATATEEIASRQARRSGLPPS